MTSPALNSEYKTHGIPLDLGMMPTVRATMIGCAKSVQVQMELNAFTVPQHSGACSNGFGLTIDKRKSFKNRVK